jgi:hypothetical protein
VNGLSSSNVDYLRECVRADYAQMPAEDLAEIVDGTLSELSPDAAENFLKALGSIGKAVGPVLQRLGPGVGQGAMTGASVGGPWGALIGAGAGLASGLLGGKAKAPRVPPRVPGIPAMTGGAPPGLPTGRGAAGALLGLLQNPAVHQSLLSQVLGSAGAPRIPTPSGASVPRAAINNLLTQLLANATEDLPESEAADGESYLQGADGEYLIDPASLEQQAALVLSRLTRPLRALFPSEDAPAFDAVEAFDEAVEFY